MAMERVMSLIVSGCRGAGGAVLVLAVTVSWRQAWTSQAEGKEAQRQVQNHCRLKARSEKIRIPPDLGHWALSLKGELS